MTQTNAEVESQLEDVMPRKEELKFSINIEYDDFLTRFDLDEILMSIDRIVEDELFTFRDPEYRCLSQRYPFNHRREEAELSYIGITGIGYGSIILCVLVSGAVATYVARRFKKEVHKSLLAEQIERGGQLTGDFLGFLLSRINDWAIRYVPKQRDLGGKVTKIEVTPK